MAQFDINWLQIWNSWKILYVTCIYMHIHQCFFFFLPVMNFISLLIHFSLFWSWEYKESFGLLFELTSKEVLKWSQLTSNCGALLFAGDGCEGRTVSDNPSVPVHRVAGTGELSLQSEWNLLSNLSFIWAIESSVKNRVSFVWIKLHVLFQEIVFYFGGFKKIYVLFNYVFFLSCYVFCRAFPSLETVLLTS